MTELRKIAVVMRISDELLNPPEPSDGHLEPPSAEEIAAYEAWKAKFEPLREEGRRRGWYQDGGPDYGFEYQPPRDEWVFDDEEQDA